MKIFKQLPLTLAVIATLCPISAFAQEFTQEQIDQIVAKAVDKALADREAKMDAARQAKNDPLVTPQAPAPDTPDLAIPYGVKFTGYARYGAHFQAGDQKYIGVDGSYNGSSAIGRLGNEGNGGEFQLTKAFKSESGAIWDVGVMFDHWGDEVNLKKAYAGVTNLFESQPNAYFWAGRDFHQRPQQGINDYFFMNHDGQGAGVKNFDLGFAQVDLAAVASVESCNPELVEDGDNPSRISCTGSSGTGDKGNYAATSKLHGIKMGPIDFELYANYGFDSKAIDSDERSKAWQAAVVFSHTGVNSLNKIIARYSDHSDNSVYNKTNGLHTVYASFEGSYKFTPQAQVEYLLAFHDYDNDEQTQDSRRNYGAIVRPMYFWNDVHSTWLEAGYQRVDYDSDGDNKGWKLTLSQNISIAMGPAFRPMLRFYVTGGQVENNHTARVAGEESTQLDSFNIGGMWEAWF
ncbi:carbohydrate porin [Enterobacteriaceae bacterium H20N1]|uniref:Carbohydrate porin n=1 Tax=Dryocola boscaweniae TaxID=2925397 RepID=A0A9X3AMV3_9ENTR|nr:carbohydrate porin [Dryocola boscaweniae]MCT4701061.1 carbohydrate porin [Dryocola boscaweniae]MCT4718105.1 carbohydrate porin [Dryocola boscaweniae]